MEKRLWKKDGLEIPLLGMGLMRLPMKDGAVDDEKAIPMVDEMYAAGVRYFDTAYVYMNGESEKFAKRALTDRLPRDQFYITSKLPSHMVNSPEDAEKVFSTSCERLGVDYIDFYLYHGINGGSWKHFKDAGCDGFLAQLKAQGRIKHMGFSFHGSPEDLRMILNDRDDWDFVQLQINYYDWYNDTAKELYEIAAEKGLPVVVMEPVRGGALFQQDKAVEDVFGAARPGDSNVKWAMRFVGSLPGVNVVLSGVSTLEQVRENVKLYSPLEPVTEQDNEVYKKVVELILARPFIPCTGCHYCDGCPKGVSIPDVFEAYNEYARLYSRNSMIWKYFDCLDENERATSCIKCGACAAKCPQHIDIPAELEKCHELITKVYNEQ